LELASYRLCASVETFGVPPSVGVDGERVSGERKVEEILVNGQEVSKALLHLFDHLIVVTFSQSFQLRLFDHVGEVELVRGISRVPQLFTQLGNGVVAGPDKHNARQMSLFLSIGVVDSVYQVDFILK
jgi:hypothetical protein